MISYDALINAAERIFFMKIDILSEERATVSLDDRELELFGAQFDSMNTSDKATRCMLGDILNLLGHMGIRKHGERVEIDCVKTKDGCLLLFNIKRSLCKHFSSIDALIDAAKAGALPKSPLKLARCDDGSCLLYLSEPLSEEAQALLSEFCE